MPPIVAVMVYSFQSTHPSRGATREQGGAAGRHRISIHAPLAGCDHYEVCHARKTWWISIHAPLAGCDAFFTGAVSRDGISIHAPLAGCDFVSGGVLTVLGIFQSTHPLRGATRTHPPPLTQCTDFNPRTPCGVRLEPAFTSTVAETFQSTHPLRGATRVMVSWRGLDVFQSTHPLRGATPASRRWR